jgi:hypothetical protein
VAQGVSPEFKPQFRKKKKKKRKEGRKEEFYLPLEVIAIFSIF